MERISIVIRNRTTERQHHPPMRAGLLTKAILDGEWLPGSRKTVQSSLPSNRPFLKFVAQTTAKRLHRDLVPSILLDHPAEMLTGANR